MINSFRLLVLATLAAAAYFMYFTKDGINSRARRAPQGGVEMTSGLPSSCSRGDTSVQSRTIALTFDGGPSNTLTPRVLDILRGGKVKAAFHVSADVLSSNAAKQVLKNILADGHLIGQRWPQSVDLSTISDADFKTRLVSDSTLIYNVAGVWPKSIRFPVGSATDNQIAIAVALKYVPVWYDIDSGDYLKGATVGSVVGQYKSVFEQELSLPLPGSHIAINEDLAQVLVDSLPSILANITSFNYKTVALDACLGLSSPYRSASDNGATTAAQGVKPNSASTLQAPLVLVSALAFFALLF